MTDKRPTAINHTSFTVGDLDRTAGFFREALGLEVENLTPASQAVMEGVTGVKGATVRVAYVRCQGHQIELFEYLSPAGRDKYRMRPCDVGASHVAFEVADMDFVLQVGERYGFKVLHAPTLVDLETLDAVATREAATGQAMLNSYVQDSDGLMIELMQFM